MKPFFVPVRSFLGILLWCFHFMVFSVSTAIANNSTLVVVCPDDITITCNEIDDIATTGLPSVTGGCDAFPMLNYADELVSGDCASECSIERTWRAEDSCGEVGTCIQFIIKNNHGSIEEALSMDLDEDGEPDPLELGVNHNTLTLEVEDAPCIANWFPGGDAEPAALSRGNTTVDPIDCLPGANPVADDGQFLNPLVMETLILALDLRLNPENGDILLAEKDCDFHPVLFQYMVNDPTVNDLLDFANIALGRVIGPIRLELLLEALECVNEETDFCVPSNAGQQGLQESTLPDLDLNSNVHRALNLYPNPTDGMAFLEVESFLDEEVTINLFDATGRVWWTQSWFALDHSLIELDLFGMPTGLYMVEVRSGEQSVRKKLMKGRR